MALEDRHKGTVGNVQLRGGGAVYGELLSVHDTTIAMLDSNRVIVGRLSEIESIDFENFSLYQIPRNGWTADDIVRRGNAVARFPYGITDAALRRLLVSSGQAVPLTLSSAKR